MNILDARWLKEVVVVVGVLKSQAHNLKGVRRRVQVLGTRRLVLMTENISRRSCTLLLAKKIKIIVIFYPLSFQQGDGSQGLELELPEEILHLWGSPDIGGVYGR